MKIGFPIEKKHTSTMIADSFHGSEWIGSIDLFSAELKKYSVTELEAKTGYDNLFSILNELEIKTVVCKKMQPMALKFFSDHRILVYRATSGDIQANIELLKEGKLNRFTTNMAEPSGCGSSCSGSSCSSCGTGAFDDIEYL